MIIILTLFLSKILGSATELCSSLNITQSIRELISSGRAHRSDLGNMSSLSGESSLLIQSRKTDCWLVLPIYLSKKISEMVLLARKKLEVRWNVLSFIDINTASQECSTTLVFILSARFSTNCEVLLTQTSSKEDFMFIITDTDFIASKCGQHKKNWWLWLTDTDFYGNKAKDREN